MLKTLDKSLATNLIALALILAGQLSPLGAETLKAVGFFAFSGAVTNWLAIYMLFEKVPFMYGSGVVPERFEEFKTAIKQLMMAQFFTAAHIEQFIEREEAEAGGVLNMQPLLDAVDYDRLYDDLAAAIMASQFGPMLAMMGGEAALTSLKAPFTGRVRQTLEDMTTSEGFRLALSHGLDARKISHDLIGKIESVIDLRLAELTPEMVKQMVQAIIREHLGWLVVWGGVCGGLIGAVFGIA